MNRLEFNYPSHGLLEHAFRLMGEIDGEEGTTYEEARLVFGNEGIPLTQREWKIFEQMFCLPVAASGVESSEYNPWFLDFAHDCLEKLKWVDANGHFQKEGYAHFKQEITRLKGSGLVTNEAELPILVSRYEALWRLTNGIGYDGKNKRHPLLPEEQEKVGPSSKQKNFVATMELLALREFGSFRKAGAIAEEPLGLQSDSYNSNPWTESMAGLGWTLRWYPKHGALFAEGTGMMGAHNAAFNRTAYEAVQKTHWAMAGHLASGYTFFKAQGQPLFSQLDARLSVYGFLDDTLSGALSFPPLFTLDEKLFQAGRFVVNGSLGLQTFTSNPFYEIRTGFEF